jgi:mono/diheme cytochrome c family protein
MHNDADPPAWWLLKKKRRIYADGFAAKDHRALMQFMLVRKNGPEKFREWEDDYRDVLAWIESLAAPSYPFSIDRSLVRTGETLFTAHCAECHGTYGRDSHYPNRIVPIDVVDTDPTRLRALSREHRAAYGRSWFTHFDAAGTLEDPGGYLAPPLDGVWASAPYFHNGSVPTLWHVLHPDQRPSIWLRTEDGYDQQRVGLEISQFEKMPDGLSRAERRRYFDTRGPSKSAAGHRFPDALSEQERAAVLEYLKTL